jgi:hypothetical protein
MPTCSTALPALELVCHIIVRRRKFHARAFFAFLATITVCVVVLPLFVTDTVSYGAAQKVCFGRHFQKWNATFLDPDSSRYRPDWDMDEVDISSINPYKLVQYANGCIFVCIFVACGASWSYAPVPGRVRAVTPACIGERCITCAPVHYYKNYAHRTVPV